MASAVKKEVQNLDSGQLKRLGEFLEKFSNLCYEYSVTLPDGIVAFEIREMYNIQGLEAKVPILADSGCFELVMQ